MEKLFLVDAYALIFRAYYAFINNPRINSKGMNTSAVLGFVNTLREILQKEKPTHMGVAFDIGKTFRHDTFPQYKAQREATPEDIRASVPVIKDILRAMNIPVLAVEGFEADDVIGTLATKAGQKGITTYMVSPDKDYAQLVSDNVLIYRPRHNGGFETMTAENVMEKYGITSTAQVIDLLALMGDSADNFPGCPGVGEKTAAKLINQFGSVEEMMRRTDEIKGKLREKVEGNIDNIKMSYFLATIRRDVPVELDMEALTITDPDEAALRAIFNELEFRSLADRMLGTAKEKPRAPQQLDLFGQPVDTPAEAYEASPDNKNDGDDGAAALSDITTTPHDYRLITSDEDMKTLCHTLMQADEVSMDTETTSTTALEAELVGMSFAIEEHKAFYVAVPDSRQEALKVVQIFRPLFEDDRIRKVGQNIKYDIEVLSNYDTTVRGQLFDTMIAHYLIQPELRHNMDYMAETLLHYRTVHIDELIGAKGKDQKSMRQLPPEKVYEYAAEDADITLQLKNVLCKRLNEAGAASLFHDIECPLISVLAQMECNGVTLDTASLADVSKTFTQQMNEYERKVFQLAGEEFNISSPKQVGDILFGKMHIMEKPKKTRTGQYVTSEEVLQQLKGKSDIIEPILAWRGLKKLLGTYVDALPKLINPHTGRIHTSFNQAVTATGRLSSSDPNLQNIPVRGEDGKEIRKCFIPEKGCLFFSADYSQIELRVMAHLSGDENMIEAFREGYDIHAATAAKVYHKDISEVTRDERTKAKRANFGIIYGITVFGLAERLEISRDEAKQLIEGYFTTFPKVRDYMERAKQTAREKGYAETLFKRRRYLPDISSRNGTVRGFAERNAINAPIQGSAADIMKVAMINIARRFEKEHIKSKMILQVHDELNFSVLPGEKEKVENIVLEEMQGAYPLAVPLVADSGWGNNWLEAH